MHIHNYPWMHLHAYMQANKYLCMLSAEKERKSVFYRTLTYSLLNKSMLKSLSYIPIGFLSLSVHVWFILGVVVECSQSDFRTCKEVYCTQLDVYTTPRRRAIAWQTWICCTYFSSKVVCWFIDVEVKVYDRVLVKKVSLWLVECLW